MLYLDYKAKPINVYGKKIGYQLVPKLRATKLVEELAACRMPYVCPRGKPIMIFTSTRELNRKFGRD